MEMKCVDVPDDVVDELRKMHDSGKTFFPEEDIRSIEEQLTAGKLGIIVKDIRGIPSRVVIKPDQNTLQFSSIVEICAPHRHLPVGFGPYHTMFIGEPIVCPGCVNPNQFATTKECKKILHNAKKEWKRSNASRHLRRSLAAANLPRNITKIVGFGLGTLERSGELRNAGQHILLLSIKDFLDTNRPDSAPVKCYAQDPAYTNGDTGALLNREVEVVPRNGGLFQVDKNTVVVSGSPQAYPIEDLVADRCRPAVFITCPPDSDMPSEFQWGPRAQEMLDSYDSFLVDGDREWFSGVCIMYVRKNSDDGGTTSQFDASDGKHSTIKTNLAV